MIVILRGRDIVIKTITFSGASDDLVHVDGGPKRYDELNTYEPIYFVVGGKLRVRVSYEDNGCWMVGASPYDEDIAVPSDWNVTLIPRPDSSYAMQLQVEVPDDISVVREG